MIEAECPDVGAYCIRPEMIEAECPDVGAYCIRPEMIEAECPDVGAYCIRPEKITDAHNTHTMSGYRISSPPPYGG